MVFGLFGRNDNDKENVVGVFTLVTDNGSRMLLKVCMGKKINNGGNPEDVYKYFLTIPKIARNEFEIKYFVSPTSQKDLEIDDNKNVNVKNLFMGKRIRFKTKLSTNLITQVLDGNQIDVDSDMKRAA